MEWSNDCWGRLQLQTDDGQTVAVIQKSRTRDGLDWSWYTQDSRGHFVETGRESTECEAKSMAEASIRRAQPK